MKKLLIFFIILFSNQFSSLHSQVWINIPSPDTIGSFVSQSFGSNMVGYIVPKRGAVEGRVLKTTNGGLNWFLTSQAVVTSDMVDVSFLNENTGYLVSTNPSGIGTNVVKTTDGAITWVQKTPIPAQFILQEVKSASFVNTTTGYAVTAVDHNYISGTGKVYKTTNSGDSWTEQYLGVLHNPIKVKFFDENFGIITCDSGYIYRTSNGGLNWTSQRHGVYHMIDVAFVNKDTIFLTGNIMFKSVDGGLSWTTINPIAGGYSIIDFVDNNTGIAVSGNHYVYVTTNCGEKWTNVSIVPVDPYYSVNIIEGTKTLMTADDGVILYSSILGIQIPDIPILQSPSNNSVQTFLTPTLKWQPSFGVFEYNIQISKDSTFSNLVVDVNTDTILFAIPRCTIYNFNRYYWRVRASNLAGVSQWSQVRNFQTRPPYGWYAQVTNSPGITFNSCSFLDTLNGWVVGSSGKIMHTTSGGDCWEDQRSDISTSLNSVSFINENNGISVGDSGKIIQTTNGGYTWQVINGITSQKLNSVIFVNSSDAYISGNNGVLFKTTNGGINWSLLQSGTSRDMNLVSFKNSLTGWVVGDSGMILRTSNGGINWFQNLSGITDELNSIFMKSLDTGWCVGSNGRILKTINGGDNWEIQSSVLSNNLRSISVNRDGIIWAVGDNGKVTVSSNGGSNWAVHYSPTINNLTNIFIPVSASKLWVCGENGLILNSTRSDILSSLSQNHQIPNGFGLNQNYPNPFNPSTIISFEIPNVTNVELTIYDILGKTISTLVNESLSPGIYEYQWNAEGFPSGIYFYKIKAGDFVETRRMVLLK